MGNGKTAAHFDKKHVNLLFCVNSIVRTKMLQDYQRLSIAMIFNYNATNSPIFTHKVLISSLITDTRHINSLSIERTKLAKALN